MEDRSSQTPKNGSGLGLWFLEGVAEFASDTFGEVLGTAIGEVLGIAVIAIFCAGIAFVAYGVFQITYELMFDPNAADVASRLAGLSISPEKWI